VNFSAPVRLGPNQQRGSVLPFAMVILLVLSAVLMGLSMLTGQEPLVASNHAKIAQAQALAEAGLERALWALSSPQSPDGVRWNAVAPAPYDGSRLIGVATQGAQLGGFRLTISGESDRQRQVLAIGVSPGDDAVLGQARQEISATLIRLRFPLLPAGLSVRGDLSIGDNVLIDASADGSCGDMAGTWSSGATTLGLTSQVRGRAGDPSVANDAANVAQRQPVAAFDDVTFTPGELSALKAVARARGTYYRGTIAFDATRRLPEGVVFVDTVSGQPISEATPEADLAAVSVGDGAGTGPGGSFRGWLIVNGSLSVAGSVLLEGLAYAVDRFSQTGPARLVGAAVAAHARSTTPSVIDARPASGAAVVWSCETGRTGGQAVRQRWMVKPGSYREATP